MSELKLEVFKQYADIHETLFQIECRLHNGTFIDANGDWYSENGVSHCEEISNLIEEVPYTTFTKSMLVDGMWVEILNDPYLVNNGHFICANGWMPVDDYDDNLRIILLG